MHYKIFSLYPQIFNSFWENSLIARAVAKKIISYEMINWKQEFGIGNYKQVDDRIFGGGTGMVLKPEPIYQALIKHDAVSPVFEILKSVETFSQLLPPNSNFYNYWKENKPKKVTISLTPRGFPLNQNIVEWLQNFSDISILCGRFEGFDARVSSMVDLEISIGNFVTNGGEVPAMALVEAVSRFVPDFITKSPSVLHDSFSSLNNQYMEFDNILKKGKLEATTSPKFIVENKVNQKNYNLFNDEMWKKDILPFIEHPQFTRPEVFENMSVPEVLKNGDHKLIAKWRESGWYKEPQNP